MEGAVDIDEQIRRTRARVTAAGAPGDLGELVPLLLFRGHLALRDDRDADASADYREAAGLLAPYHDDDLPVSIVTARMVWASWSSRARHEGLLDEALAAARRAVRLRAGLPADDIQPYAGFYSDLKDLTSAFERAGRAEERVESARLALEWSRALYAVDPRRFDFTLGITGAALARALGDSGRLEDAIEAAGEALPVLRTRGLNAIALSLLLPLGTWLRERGRCSEAADAMNEALACVRAQNSRRAVVEVHVLRSLARSQAGAGRPAQARSALQQAMEVITAPGPGVVPLRDDQTGPIAAEVRAELASLDSTP